VVHRFSVAVQTEGQHPFMQVDELPLEGLHNGRFYQVGPFILMCCWPSGLIVVML
jgi:hypothetical protein